MAVQFPVLLAGLLLSFSTSALFIPPSVSTIELTAKHIQDETWLIGKGDPYVSMAQLVLTVDTSEDTDIRSLQLLAAGSGDESISIAAVIIAEDRDRDGIYSESMDAVWATDRYTFDNGTLFFPINKRLAAGSSTHLLIVYQLGGDFHDGETFSLSMSNITAEGVLSKKIAHISTLPFTSHTLTALTEEPTCSGPLTLTITPSPIQSAGHITMQVSGLEHCTGKGIAIIQHSCIGGVFCACTAIEGGCSCEGIAPAQPKTYTFAACADLNDDLDYFDNGESVTSTLLVEERTDIPEPPLSSLAFTDIRGHWAEDAVALLQERGIAQGKKNGQFDPDAPIARAELTKMAMLAFREPEKLNTAELVSLLFTDTAPHEWFASYVARARKYKIIQGYSDGTFRPAQTTTRAEALKMLLQTAGRDTSLTDVVVFPDTEAHAWYTPYLSYAVLNDIASGYAKGEFAGLFKPERPATRAEVAVMITRLLNTQ
ncbi:hypothetical protein COU77_03965 [Candidatus Peregrinibacteria bacterium CG10_big_fil_rev_8_21_14_0_10_49_16]|nr:MAG: hypothetical protein COW95_03975 [Candidatus Peregrinibacteria bacterium CG22_combo_CG10-13_8_21_14_all_49_11]PIR51768.1 MAG: hypothetical protein COU77_03965 [Candidatus Peregrinibacteria bacterium CG10_big_fil_rev_8_21_14_0_10_49_16]